MYINRMLRRRRLVLGLCFAAACSRTTKSRVPAADLVATTPDSSFWITSDSRGLRMRGAPMLLARVDGRFQELYVTDDDRSYYDAVFVGQRLFMRDLLRGDSVEVLVDTLIPRLERTYHASHPREERLDPEDQASDNPGTTATADFQIIAVHGPYLSYEYHTDVDAAAPAGNTDRHAARRGVLDLRTRKAVPLEALLGREVADRTVAAALKEWEGARDSLLSRTDDASRRAQRNATSFAFDAHSYNIGAFAREPEVIFGVPGSMAGGNSGTLELSAQAVTAPAWWSLMANELPTGPDSARVWSHGKVSLAALVAGGTEHAILELRDSADGRWSVGSVTAPVDRVLWLDSISTQERTALRRAFNDASQYSDDRVIAASPRLPSHGLPSSSRLSSPDTRLSVYHALPPLAHGQIHPTHHVRPHDADGRERTGPRVRRRDTRHDGQDGRRVRHPPLALNLRDGVGRSRGLPRADTRRGAGAHGGERQLRGTHVDGDRHPDRGGEHADRRPPAYQLVLHDVRRD